ncbi:MAG: hypothetical protein QXG86_03085 [Candidatus Woesearchaeota archaeon]
MDSLSQLKIILKNSFAGIKNDMNELKQFQQEAMANSYKIKQDLDAIKNDYTPKDRFNLLKIQVGELNDQLKKIWELERDIKKLNDKKIDRTDFNHEIEKFREEVNNKITETNSNLNKKITQLNDKTASTFEKINESMKLLVTKNQISTLISDINNEFNSLRASVEEIKKIKDIITARELERRTGIINARIDLLAKEIVKANQKIAECVTGEQVKKLVSEINVEFDDIKKAISDLSKVRNLVREVDSESVKRNEFSRRIIDIQSDITKQRKEIQELRDFISKNYSKNDETKRMLNSLELTIIKRIKEVEDEIYKLKKEQTKDEKKKIKEDKGKKYEKREIIEIKESPKRDAKEKTSKLKILSVISIIIIALSFISLAAAITFYFAMEEQLTNYFTISAVALFITGILMRIFLAKKKAV